MELIRGIHNIRARHHGCVLTIGNFDGVHRGHQALLEQLKREGQRLGLPVMVMIFEPQPLELFAADKAPARLTRLRDKARYLAEAGVDYLLCVKFDPRFAANTAQAFVAQLLVEKLGVKFLTVGDDFRFGAERQGIFNCYNRRGLNLALMSSALTASVTAGCALAAPRFVRRFMMTIWCRLRCYLVTRTVFLAVWFTVMNWGGRLASPRRICR